MSTMRVKNKDGTWDKVPVLGSYQAAFAANEAATNAQNAATSVQKYKTLWFDSVAAMKAEPSLTAGAYVCTAGYYEPNDGGGASYLIRAKADTDVDDGGSINELANGLIADLIVENGTVCPEQFGAVGDGVADDTDALKAAAAYAHVYHVKLIGAGSYMVSDTIELKCNCDLGNSNIYADAEKTKLCIMIGSTSETDILYNANLILPQKVHNSKWQYGNSNWDNFSNSVGLEISNAYYCHIVINDIQGFEIGLHIGAHSYGTCCNNIIIGSLIDNKKNLVLSPNNSDGWVNNNTIIGGKYYHHSFVGNRVAGTRKIAIEFEEGFNNIPNGNVFINPNIEGPVAEYDLYINGSFNTFIAPRFEVNTEACKIHFHANTGKQTVHNIILGGYESETQGYGIETTTSGDGWIRYNERFFGSENNMLAGNIKIQSGGGGSSTPHIAGYIPSYPANLSDKINNNQQWTYNLYGFGMEWKQPSDAYSRLKISYDGKIYFGGGAAENQTAYLIGDVQNTINCNAKFRPVIDNNFNLGDSSFRWKQLFAGVGTIATSDEREKYIVGEIEESVFQAWGKVNFLKYKFNNAIEEKGYENARIHVGLIAQHIKKAFEDEGLDAFNFGLLCYDEWGDEYNSEGDLIKKAGSRYGIRYEEALSLECAYQRWRLNKLEQQILCK